MTTVRNPVTDADLVLFDSYVKKWQGILNLNVWRMERGTRRPKKWLAEVVCNDEGMLATYLVGASFHALPVTPETLESTALHEVLHVLLRKFKQEQSEANEHEIVNMFEKLLMEAKL